MRIYIGCNVRTRCKHLFIIYYPAIHSARVRDVEPLYAIIILLNDQEPVFYSFFLCRSYSHSTNSHWLLCYIELSNWKHWEHVHFSVDEIHSNTSKYKKVWFSRIFLNLCILMNVDVYNWCKMCSLTTYRYVLQIYKSIVENKPTHLDNLEIITWWKAKQKNNKKVMRQPNKSKLLFSKGCQRFMRLATSDIWVLRILVLQI